MQDGREQKCEMETLNLQINYMIMKFDNLLQNLFLFFRVEGLKFALLSGVGREV